MNASAGQRNDRVLIVDDEHDLITSVSRILRMDGFQVVSASSLGEMLTRTDLADFFAILLDRKLPDGLSDRILPQLSQRAPSANIIIVTGYADLESSIAALRNGAEDYLIKPIDPDDLRKRLARLVELRRNEEALRQERELVQGILRTAQSIILVLDSEGRIVRYNPYLEHLTGRPLSHFRGHCWFQHFIPDRDRDRIRDVFRRCLRGENVSGYINPIILPDGTTRDIMWYSTCLFDSSGNLLGVVGSGHDLTELQDLHRKLVQSERLAAIGEAMTGLSHESRNSLQRCQACVDLLTDQNELSSNGLELLHGIQRALDDLNRLYEEVRQYAAPIHLECERRSIRDIVRATWQELAPSHTARETRLHEFVECTDLYCVVDPFHVGRVFRNLFENSLAACKDPVEISIGYQDSKCEGAGYLRIAVRDNGPGLNDEQKKRAFDSFYTTKTKGTGLGLAIAKRIIDAHGGTIAVNQELVTGAEFILTLPRLPSV